MFKYNKKKGEQKASESAQSDVSMDPQLPSTSFPTGESQAGEQPPATEDSKAGSHSGAEPTKGESAQAKVDVNRVSAFFSKAFGKSTKSRTTGQSEDVAKEGESLKKPEEVCQLESKNVLEPGGESSSQSSNIFEPRGKQVTTPVDSSTDKTVQSSTQSGTTGGSTSASNRCCKPFEDCWDSTGNYWRDSRCLKQLIDGIIFYTVFSVAAMIVCLSVGISRERQDVLFCVIAAIVWCFFVTLAFERGCLRYWWVQRAKAKKSQNGGNADYPEFWSCFWCKCCNIDVPEAYQRHTGYMHRREKGTTEFIEVENPSKIGSEITSQTVSDTSKTDPEQNPQTKMVKQTGGDSSSSDLFSATYGTEMVRADVHRPEAEEDGILSGCVNRCPGACGCPQPSTGQKSKVPELKYLKKSERNVPVCERCGGQRGACTCLARKQKPEVGEVCATSGLGQKPKSEIEDPQARSPPKSEGDSVCERCGQSGACPCAERALKKKPKARDTSRQS